MLEILLSVFLIIIMALLVYLVVKLEKLRKEKTESRIEMPSEILKSYAEISSIKDKLNETKDVMQDLRLKQEEGRRIEEESKDSIRRLEKIIAGVYSKGLAGENILGEVLNKIPSHMIERDIRLGTKVVEYGFVMPDGKVLPIDSKWPGTNTLEEIENEEDLDKKNKLIKNLTKEVERRNKEIVQYIDPSRTTPWAILAVPDAVYNYCRDIHYSAFQYNIFLMPYQYSLTFLLMFYSFYNKFSKSINLELLQSHLLDIDRILDNIEEVMSNKLSKGLVMAENAKSEIRNYVASIKNSSLAMQTIEGKIEQQEVPSLKSE